MPRQGLTVRGCFGHPCTPLFIGGMPIQDVTSWSEIPASTLPEAGGIFKPLHPPDAANDPILPSHFDECFAELFLL